MNEKVKKIMGTGVALVTPFHGNGAVDFDSLQKLVAYVVDGGVDFVVALGTTAEAATLSAQERSAVVDAIYEAVEGRCGFVVGAGGNNTATVVQTIKALDESRVDAVLSVSPYYNKPNQSGIYAHFKELAMNTTLPLILYNVPGRTSSNIQAETTVRLARDFENIVAVKEASGNMQQMMEIIKNRPEGFLVLSGDDALTLPMLALGADGVISVVANACPATMSGMVHAMVKTDDRFTAVRYHYEMLDIINALFADGNPGGIKALLEIKGLIKNNLRLPLVRVDKTVYEALAQLDKSLNLE